MRGDPRKTNLSLYGRRDFRGESPHGLSTNEVIIVGIEVLIKQLGKLLIPFFLFFLPIGLILIFKKIEYNKLSIIITLSIGLLASVYILSATKDMRYIFWLIPMFCVLSCLSIRFYFERFRFNQNFLLVIMIGVIISSIGFLYLTDDNVVQEESHIITQIFSGKNMKINDFTHISAYAKSLSVLSDDKILGSSSLEVEKILVNSVDDFMITAKKQGVTHLVLDNKNIRLDPLDDIFYNYEKYPYLIKIFDSKEQNFENYHVKIFKIDLLQ